MKSWFRFLGWILTVCLFPTFIFAQGVFTAGFQDRLETADPSESFRVLVLMKDQLNTRAMDAGLSETQAPLAYRHQVVVEALQNKAYETQAEILNAIRSYEAEGKVIFYRSFWIVNAINLEATADVILQLGKRPEVQLISLDGRVYLDAPVERNPATELQNSAEPGLKAIKADLLWKKNIKGAGVIVMNIDTGVDGSHPALNARWRGNQPGVSPSAAWFDPETNSSFPSDPDGHGTHTMGTMTGLVEADNDTIGVAFEAQWIAARTLNTANYQSNNIAAFQWAADPDGNPATVSDVPAVISCSWRDPSEPFCATTYWSAIDNVEAAGAAVVFSAGNGGPGAQTITQPKNRITTPVNIWATGAVDGNNPAFPIADFSSRGPSLCDNVTIKPEASAPGVSVRSSVPGNGYAFFSGTSMASPHVGGAIALLRSAHPNMTGTDLKYALLETAVDLGVPGEDNDYGMGIIDVFAAYNSLADSLDPEPPTNLTAYSDYSTPTSIQLNWTDPDHFAGGDTLLPAEFNIQIERDGTLIDSVPGGTQMYTDGGLIDGQMYSYNLYTKVIATDSTSLPVEVSWVAGGSPIPTPPDNLMATGDQNQVKLTWQNPRVNIDGTPMDDFAGVNLYQDGSYVATFVRSAADTGKADSANYTPTTPGIYQWYLTAFDNEFPSNESAPSNTAYTPLSIPFSDDFPVSGDPNPAFWFNENADVNDMANNPPSPPYALNLNGFPDGGDQVDLLPVDLSGQEGNGVVFAYYFQPQGNGNEPEAGDSLLVYFKNDLGDWILVKGYPGMALQPFQLEVIDVETAPNGGGTYFFSQFQVRFRSKGTESSTSVFDDWFVDNVFLGVPNNTPQMVVTPGSIADTLLIGQSVTRFVMVQNTNSLISTLNYSVVQDPVTSWLTVSPLSGTVGALQEDTLSLTIDATGLSAGNYSTNVIVSGDDPDNPEDTVNVAIVVNEAPDIKVSPDSLFFVLDPAQIDTAIMSISNVGLGPLEILSIEDEEITGEENWIPKFVQPQKPFVNYEKGAEEPTFGKLTEGQGGPDPFGYTWIDSDEPGGPAYQFIDISTLGTPVNLVPTGSFDPKDEGMGTVQLPFNVKFYGKLYNQLQVNTNGFVTFDMNFFANAFTNQNLPNSADPNNLIAVFWDDLDGSVNNGEIYTLQAGNRFIIQWDNWSHFLGTENMKFQIVLFQNSSTVLFAYEEILDDGSATFGIENEDGTVALLIGYNQIYAHNQLLTRISKGVEWLSEEPTSGTVNPGETLPVNVIANSTGLVGGTYNAQVIVTSNDPVTPDTSIFVRLTVSGIPNIEISPDTLLFDTLLAGAQATLPFDVTNSGSFDLNVSNIFTTDANFAVDTTSFVLPAQTSQTVNVTFSPAMAGTYSGYVVINSDDPDTPVDSVYVMGVATENPVIGVTPDSLSFQLLTNQSDSDTFNILNTGNGPLQVLGMETEEITETVMGAYKNLLIRKGYQSRYAGGQEVKGQPDTRPGMTVTEGQGGPDLFGYKWIDSDEPNGPAFNWIDISATGTPLTLQPAGSFDPKDEGYAVVTLPFPVKFYGQDVNGIVVHTNGFIVFDPTYVPGSFEPEDPIPTANLPNALAAPLWDDLDGSVNNGEIYVQAIGNQFIIQYDNWSNYSSSDVLTFEIILTQGSHSILFQYQTFQSAQLDYTVGIENFDGNDGLEISYHPLSPYLKEQMAIKISKGVDWLTLSPTSGTVQPGGSMDVQATVNASSMLGGTYRANVVITSNDPVNSTLRKPVVTLRVIGVPDIAVSPDSLFFDTTFVGVTELLDLLVENQGSDTLFVYDIASTNAVFTVDTTSLVLPPFASYEVGVSFASITAGTFSGEIRLASNDPDVDTVTVYAQGTALPPPVISVNPTSITTQISPGDSQDVAINIANAGLSPLSWSATARPTERKPGVLNELQQTPLVIKSLFTDAATLHLRFEKPVEALGDTLFAFNASAQTPTPDVALLGVEFAMGSFWATGRDPNGGEIHKIYKFDATGNLVSFANQNTTSTWGWRDMAFDGTYLYASDSPDIVQIDPMTMQPTGVTISGPLDPNRALAYDPATDHFWTANFASDIFEIDRSGNIINQFPNSLSAYGAGWDQWSADGPYLWIWSQDGPAGGPSCTATQIDPATGAVTGVSFVGIDLNGDPTDDDLAGGATLTDEFASGKLALVGLHQSNITPGDGMDYIVVYDMDVSITPDFIKLLPPTAGVLDPGQNTDLMVRLYGLTTTEQSDTLKANVEIASNDPSNPLIQVPVTVAVVTAIENVAALPTTFDVSPNYPNPFNPSTTIKFQLPRSEQVKLVIYNILGQKVRTLVNKKMEPGYYKAVWDGTNDSGNLVATGIYIYRFEAGDFLKVRKMIMLK